MQTLSGKQVRKQTNKQSRNKYFTFCTNVSRQEETSWNKLIDSNLMLIHNGKVIIFSRIKNLQQSGFSFYNFQLSKTKVWNKIKCSSQLVTASCSEFLIIYHYSAQLLYLTSLQDQVCSFCNEPKVLTLKGGHVSCSLHLLRNELHITRFQNAHRLKTRSWIH